MIIEVNVYLYYITLVEMAVIKSFKDISVRN